MTVTIADGITKCTISGALIQSFEHEETEEIAETAKMVSGAAQIVRLYPHMKKSKGSVKGKGDLTLSCGTMSTFTSIGVAGGLVTGGMVHVPSVKYSEDLTKTAEWDFSYTHYPNAA